MASPITWADREEVRAVYAGWSDALLEEAYGEMLELYTDDVVMMPPDHPAEAEGQCLADGRGGCSSRASCPLAATSRADPALLLAPGRRPPQAAGSTFWFRRKRFPGSQAALISASRSYAAP